METSKATIKRTEKSGSLILHIQEQELEIILTEDSPNKVKSVFNTLLASLKGGLFAFELQDDDTDLYHDICVEYLKQLNAELQSVYDELKDYELLENNAAEAGPGE
jgi:hypothetical protein